jgi:nitroreductase
VSEAVDSRISCRWFLDRPVDPGLVRKLIASAARAASGGNLQPWQVYALTGAALAELKRQVTASIADRDPRQVDAEYPIYPKSMWEPYQSRRPPWRAALRRAQHRPQRCRGAPRAVQAQL